MPLEDKATRRLVEREIGKHPIDYSLLTVTVINGVATFRGRVSPLRGGAGRGVDIKEELRKVQDACLLIHGINEVAMDVAFDM
jgi:hypothetical protein